MKIMGRRGYRILRTVLLVLMRIWHPCVRVTGKEHIPEGAALLACNHSAFSDPIWIVVFADLPVLPRTMAKQELLKTPCLGQFYKKMGAFPVNRSGTDIAAIKIAMKTLKDNNKLIIFPEGTRVRRGKKSVPHNGSMLLATRANVPLIPIFLSTKKRPFSKVKMVVGEPIRPQYAGRRPTSEELDGLSVELLQRIYSMGETQ